jgi:hypothetical protein
MPQTVHMMPDPRGGWIVKAPGSSSDEGHFTSRGEAENFGRELCNKVNADFEIHHMDGTITREHIRRSTFPSRA